MSIFKQSFPKWIQNQLKKRQDLQATGLNGNRKSNEALVWNQSKQCVIRATSLVDYVEKVDGGLGIGNFNEISGNQLAKRFILQGGILDKGQTRKAHFGQPSSAYGDPLLGANSGPEGFGQVPMPGITSLDIATKSAYGSLRQAKLNFVVHNLRQLEVMELLYMRPGYPILVEWQWAPYVHSVNGITHRDHKVNLNTIFAEKVDQQKVYSEIVSLKKVSEGNYDGFLGFVTNFGFQARPDGGFDCYSEIVSMGEVIDSLKIGSSSHILGKIFPGKDFTFKLHKEDDDEEIKNPDILRAVLLGLAKLTGTIDTGGGEQEWAPQFWEDWFNNESGELADAIVNIIVDKFKPLQSKANADEKLQALEQYVLKTNQTTETSDFKVRLNTGYVRWDLLAFLFNELVFARPEGEEKPQIEIVQGFLRNDPNNQDNKTVELLKYLKLTGGNKDDLIDLSCDPSICILPHSFFDTRLQETINPDQGKLGKRIEGVGDAIEGFFSKFGNEVAAFFDKDVESALFTEDGKLRPNAKLDLKEEFKYSIGGIYLNTEMLLKAYDSSITGEDQSKVDFGDFFKNIWDEVNTACPLHNFIFKIDTEFPNTAYVMDLPVDNNQLKEIKDKLFEVEVQSNKSVVREYDLQATIPDALKSTVAVHAQNPDTTEDLDDLTFQAFNRSIRNRIFVPTTEAEEEETEVEDSRTEQELEDDLRLGVDSRTVQGRAKKRYLLAAEKFSKLTPLYFEIINADENGSVEDSTDVVNDLKSSLKELQTSTLQLEKLKNKNLGASAVIPLEFTMTLDGISNIVIGSVFKIRGDRLPKAYRGKVGFIVFKEEQSITSGQDWVTKIGGKMIILPTDNQGKEVAPVISSGGSSPKPLEPPQSIEKKLPPPILTEESSQELIIPPVSEQTVTDIFQEFVKLDRKYFEKTYILEVLTEETFRTGTNVFTDQINELTMDLTPIVDEWEKLKPQIETAYGADWGDYNSAFQIELREQEGSSVLDVDINGQIFRPFVLGGGVSNLRPDTIDNYLSNIFTSDEAQVGTSTPSPSPIENYKGFDIVSTGGGYYTVPPLIDDFFGTILSENDTTYSIEDVKWNIDDVLSNNS